jgi:acyl transferase domain-containing protein
VARGRLTQQAAEARPGAMLAVGCALDDAVELARRFGLDVANDNSPGQVVLSGDADAIAAARDAAKASGLRAHRLRVSGAFHSHFMRSAATGFRNALEDVEIRAPRRPVLSCLTAREFDDVRAQLADALTQPVQWRQVVLALHSRGVGRFVEAGPGKVLTGLVRRTLGEADAFSVRELERTGV